MELIPPRLLTFCLNFIPILLLLGGIFGMLGMVSIGPRELPKKHELNRYMSLSFISMGIGIWFSQMPDTWGTLGLIVAAFGLLSYTLLMRQARQEFPPMTQEQWLEVVKRRYKFASQLGQKTPPKPDDNQDEEAE